MSAEPTTTPPDDWDDAPAFSSKRKEQRVKVDGVRYLLLDMMGDDLGRWMKYQATRLAGQNKKGRPDLAAADFSEYNATLISYCLHDTDAAGKPTSRVPLATIVTWTAPVLTTLFDLAQTMNGLNEEGQADAKKA